MTTILLGALLGLAFGLFMADERRDARPRPGPGHQPRGHAGPPTGEPPHQGSSGRKTPAEVVVELRESIGDLDENDPLPPLGGYSRERD